MTSSVGCATYEKGPEKGGTKIAQSVSQSVSQSVLSPLVAICLLVKKLNGL